MSKKITTQEYRDWLLLDGRGITLVDEYVGKDTKTLFQCQHDHQWMGRPNDVRNGSGCPSCANKSRVSSLPATTDEFKQWLLQNDEGIVMVGEYVRSGIKTTFQCKHGHQWMATPASIKSDRGCPICAVNRRSYSSDEVTEWLRLDGRGITLVGEYISSDAKTLFQCQHGHQWHGRLSGIKQGRGCPQCAVTGFNPSKSGIVYAWTRDNYLKVGITNNLPRRLSQHRKYGEINMVYEKHYAIGHEAAAFERAFKEKHGGSYVTKEECPDGYTETFPLHLLEQLTEEKL